MLIFVAPGNNTGIGQTENADFLSAIDPFFENNISPIAILDKNFNFIKVNKAYAQADNRDPQDFVGRNHFELYPSGYKKIFKQVVETKKTYTGYAQPFVYEFNRKRGITYWDWTLHPILDKDGEVSLLVLSLINVTERVKALTELNNFFNLSADILLIMDFSGKIIKANYSVEKLLGYKIQEIVSKSLTGLIHPHDRLKTVRYIKNAIKKNNIKLFENRLLHKNNTYRWFEWNAKTDITHKLIYAVGRDITERKKNEKSLELFASIVNCTDDAIISRDLDGRILSWNKGAENIYGYKAGEVLGKNDIIFWPPGLKFDPEIELLERVAKGEHIKNFESVRRKKDGNLVFLSKTISPIYDKTGRIVGSTTIAKDISKQKQFEAEMMKLDRLNTLGELAASISHEVRNPLTTVKGFLQLLVNKDCYQEDKKYIKIMIDELDRVNSLISELLSIGNTPPIKFTLSDLNNIIDNLVPLLQVDALAKNNYIKLELSTIPKILLNEKQIRQVIINLVRNGLEAMPAGGKLTIRTFEEKEYVVLAVQDEGCGIPPEILNNLGKAFFTTKKDGTGLGLATTFSICKKHGARINVKTGPQGSTFEVYFQKTLNREKIRREYYLTPHNPYFFNEQFFSTLYYAIPLPTIIMNSHGNVYFVNLMAEKVLQIEYEEGYFKKGGGIINCIVRNSRACCKDIDICNHCTVKITAMAAIRENKTVQNKMEIAVKNEPGNNKTIKFLITSSPLVYREEKMAIVVIQNIGTVYS